jgi:hypothetical protein
LTPQQVLATAAERGISFDVDAEGMLIARPSALLDDTLREAIRQHKPELVRLVATRTTPMPEGWEQWRLLVFADSDHYVKVYSQALGTTVVLAGAEAVIPEQWRHLPTYRGEELLLLAAINPSPTELHQLHAVREVFGTTLQEVIEREQEVVQA